MLKAAIVFENKNELNTLNKKLCKMSAFDKVDAFNKVDELIEFVSNNEVNIVISDFKAEDSEGNEISEILHNASPQTDLIYAADTEAYAYEAWNSYAAGFILKPVKEEDILNQIRRIYKHILNKYDKLMFRCFGNFECFYKGQPVKFERKQAKEFLAYLIDRRGAEVSENEIRAILWEDAEDTIARKSYLRTLASIIRKSFEALGQNNVFNNNHGSYSINMELIDCDYYEYLNGSEKFGTFRGEYMMQYSWAEETVAALEFEFYDE